MRISKDEKQRFTESYKRQRSRAPGRSRDGRFRVCGTGEQYVLHLPTSIAHGLIDRELINTQFVPEVTDEGILYRRVQN